MLENKANVAAVTRDYNIAPRIDYRTVSKVDGPLVILENVKFPKYVKYPNSDMQRSLTSFLEMDPSGRVRY